MSDRHVPLLRHNPPRRKRSGCGKGCFIVGGVLFALLLALLVAIGFNAVQHTKAELERADQLWTEGKKEEAVRIYLSGMQFANDADLPEIYGRIITYRYDSGDTKGAAECCTKAIEEDIDLRFTRDDLRRVLANARQVVGDRKARELAREQKADEEERIKRGFSGWDGSHKGLTKVIKSMMNDPGSYEHAETVYWSQGDHLIVRTSFRGKNAFGGVVLNWVKAKVDLDGNVLEIIEQGP